MRDYKWRGAVTFKHDKAKKIGELYVTDKEVVYIHLGGEPGEQYFGMAPGGIYGMSGIMTFFELPRRLMGLSSKKLRRAAKEVDEIDDKMGAMSLEQRFSVTAGSERVEINRITSLRGKGRHKVIIKTELGDHYDFRFAGSSLPFIESVRGTGRLSLPS